VYGIALTVLACLRAGTSVDVAWLVDSPFPAPPGPNEALAITPGGGRVGSILAGALNEQVATLGTGRAGGRLVDLRISDVEAMIAGLPAGGAVRALVVDAARLPTPLWPALLDRAPVCLVSQITDGTVTTTDLFDTSTIGQAPEPARELFGGHRSATSTVGDLVISVFRPIPALVLVGTGPLVDALRACAELLGWQVTTTADAGTATGLIAGLAPMDKVVVCGHDIDLTAAALQAALEGRPGYIGALGSRQVQRARADWLARRGVVDLDRVHGPAGVDIGASTPAEIAVSVVAQAIASAHAVTDPPSAGLRPADQANA
jgi:xanthine dehydrogenase accessory factor